jgi:hypothetical protein
MRGGSEGRRPVRHRRRNLAYFEPGAGGLSLDRGGRSRTCSRSSLQQPAARAAAASGMQWLDVRGRAAARAAGRLGRTNLILRSAPVFGCTRYVCMCTENPENSGLTLRITAKS